MRMMGCHALPDCASPKGSGMPKAAGLRPEITLMCRPDPAGEALFDSVILEAERPVFGWR